MRSPRHRGLLAVVPPYTISGPPAGIAYLLGMLEAHGVHDVGFVDLRLGGPDWPSLTYGPIGRSGESYVFDVPDLPLILHLLRHRPSTEVWNDFERLPWVRSYCRARLLSPAVLGASLRATQRLLAQWAAGLDGPVFVGFSTWISNYLTSLMAAAELKRLPRPPYVVFGGPQCSDSEVAADLAVASGLVDALVVGEGEQTFLDLQARIDPVRRTLSGPVPPGVKVLEDGEVRYGGRRRLMRLDEAPLPDFDSMDLDAYSDRVRQISYQLSRGCTDRCEFCSEWVFWERFRASSPETAVGALEELQRRTGYGHVTFSDSLLNGSAKRLVAFAEQVLSSNLHFSWSGFARADITRPVARLLARAGLRHVFIGVESLSDATLANMNKRREGADNLLAIDAFLEAGLSVAAGVVAGFPGDSREAFDGTAKVLRSYVRRYPTKFQASVEPFVVTPSAAIYRKHADFGLTLVPWDDEVVDAIPALAPIVRRCMATVEGEDQQAERKRRYRSARARLQPSIAAGRSRTHAAAPDAAETLRTVPVDPRWVLALGRDRITRRAWLLSVEELESLSGGALTGAIVDDRAGAAQIRWARPLAPGAGARGVVFDRVARFGLHPAVVARYCSESERWMVMNIDTEMLYRMDAAAGALARLLSVEMRSMDELLTPRAGLGMTADQLRATLSDWWAKRLLMGLPAAH